MELSKRRSIYFISLVFILKRFTKPFIIRHFEITKEITEFCPSGFTAQSASMAHAWNGCSQSSRFRPLVKGNEDSGDENVSNLIHTLCKCIEHARTEASNPKWVSWSPILDSYVTFVTFSRWPTYTVVSIQRIKFSRNSTYESTATFLPHLIELNSTRQKCVWIGP